MTELQRLIVAVAKIAHHDAQCGEDAMKMRNIAIQALKELKK